MTREEKIRVSSTCAAAVATLLLIACAPIARSGPGTTAVDLGGTSWQLVRFQGGDGQVLIPDDRAKYTIAFASDGAVSARIDCNRGRGTWKSSGPNQLEFGPLALTRAMCPPGSLHDRMVKHWPFVRSYTIKDGRLFLALMADGGIYEFEPLRSNSASLNRVASKTARARTAAGAATIFQAR
jgi:para-nitrobenzyl esterase